MFTSETGAPLDPRNVLRSVEVAARSLGLTGVNVHSLRHTATVTMLEAGVNPRAVSDHLGHADSRITMEVYAHVSTDAKRATSAALSSKLSSIVF